MQDSAQLILRELMFVKALVCFGVSATYSVSFKATACKFHHACSIAWMLIGIVFTILGLLA